MKSIKGIIILLMAMCLFLSSCGNSRNSYRIIGQSSDETAIEETEDRDENEALDDDAEKYAVYPPAEGHDDNVQAWMDNLGGTYITKMEDSRIVGTSDLICEVYDVASDHFMLRLRVEHNSTRYELNPVSCTLYDDGTFVSDYATPTDGYPKANWESSIPDYFRIQGYFSDGGESITVTDVDEYEATYDGSKSLKRFDPIYLDGNRFWLGYFHNTTGMEQDESRFTQTANRISGSESVSSDRDISSRIANSLYVSEGSSTYFSCNIGDADSNSFSLDFAISYNGDAYSLETATCYFDLDGDEVPVQGELIPFYSDYVGRYAQELTDDNRDYWNERAYLLMGYFEPDGSAIYITVVEYLWQEDGSLVENENVDYGSWVHYFDGDNGAHRPQPAYWRM